jgi:hypothetical protein
MKDTKKKKSGRIVPSKDVVTERKLVFKKDSEELHLIFLRVLYG